MRKIVIDGYIIGLSEIKGIEITEAEHEAILEAMSHKPSREGYYYKLRDDTLTYDEFKIPEDETEFDGGDTND